MVWDARCSFGPRPSVGAGAAVVSPPGSTDGPGPDAGDAPDSSVATGSVGPLVRPGSRSLMTTISTHKPPGDRPELSFAAAPRVSVVRRTVPPCRRPPQPTASTA